MVKVAEEKDRSEWERCIVHRGIGVVRLMLDKVLKDVKYLKYI